MNQTLQERRIFTEIAYFKTIYNSIMLEIEDDTIKMTVKNPKDPSYPTVLFTMKNYPFHAPIVECFNKNYIVWRKYCAYPKIVEAINKINRINDNNTTCFCCDSIVQEWSPAIILEKILDEIMRTITLKKQVRLLFQLNEIGKRYNIPESLEIVIFKYL